MGLSILRTMATHNVKVTYSGPAQSQSNPDEVSVSIIGQVQNLKLIKFEELQSKFGSVVNSKQWEDAVQTAGQGATDTLSLYLNKIFLATLPTKCSRHNTPSRCHALTKLVKTCTSQSAKAKQTVVIVCEKRDVFASGCAVARAFPTFSRKTVAAADQLKSVPKVMDYEINVEFIIVDDNHRGLQDNDVETLNQSAHGIQLSARIVDTPCNEMHTDGFIQEVQVVGQALGITPLVIQGEELDQKGFGGIYGVGKAAIHQPALAVLSHTPEGATETVAWVGKGIVYDTGGLSIKTKTGMPGMKRDCGGAAGILGAFYLAVKQGFSQNLHAIFCLAENAVGDRATRPDDIHTLYSGKTVEINNTDAEGRLVVSDGVFYARQDLKANVIVDMCTLTGAQGISTGRYHAAHLTNDQDMEDLVRDVGKISGEMSFPLVYCPELHYPEFTSAVADMKNSVANRDNAQSSCAGLFINANLGFDYPGTWLHIDMASPVHCVSISLSRAKRVNFSIFFDFSNFQSCNAQKN